MMYWDGGWGWGSWVAMGLMMVLFFGLLAAVVVVLSRPRERRDELPAARPSAPPPAEDQALRILDARFASGEIDQEEYRARRELLASR
jgi:putative membrane protein